MRKRRLINGEDFGLVWLGSGAKGFALEGYPHTRVQGKVFGKRASTKGATFTMKTGIVDARLDPSRKLGNMWLKDDHISPRELCPDCVVFNPITGDGLNAVGLAGPGIQELLDMGILQDLTERFWFSFSTMRGTRAKRVVETEEFVNILRPHLREFKAPFGFQSNESCPNVGNHPAIGELCAENHERGEILCSLGRPRIVKISGVTPPEVAFEVGSDEFTHGLTISQTIKWGTACGIQWQRLFGWGIGPFRFGATFGLGGSNISPLEKYGGGGLSGPRLLPYGLRLLDNLRDYGYDKHVNVGGGIFRRRDIASCGEFDADSVSISTSTTLRAWRTRGLIRKAYEVLGNN
jgi:hypothetical protein